MGSPTDNYYQKMRQDRAREHPIIKASLGAHPL